MEVTLLAIVCSLIAALCVTVNCQSCTGVKVADLPNINHDVSGMLYIENETSFCISDFTYDGAGPDAFLYLYLPGEATFLRGGGVITRVPGQERIQFEVGRRYTGETFQFSVPEGHRTCDYDAFSIWCRYASQLFTLASGLQNFFTNGTSTENAIACTPSPGRAYVGALPSTSNGISGDLFAVTNKVFAIRDFSYDGQGGNEVFLYTFPVGVTPDPNSTAGTIIRYSDQGEGQLPASTVTDVQLTLTIPDDVDLLTCDVGTLTIWDRATSTFLAQISINTAESFTNNPLLEAHNRAFVLCDNPTTRPGVLVGELTKEDHGLEGTFYVQDAKTFYIQLFSYDGGGPAAYLYYYRRGQMVENTGHGYKIRFSETVGALPVGRSNSYKKHTPFIVDLNQAAEEDEVNACDVEWFTIWCEDFDVHFTRIQIPESIFTEDPNHPGIAMKNRVLCSQTTAVPTPRAGAPPTASILSTLTVCLVAIAAMFMRA